VQIPSGGAPIVLLAEHQATGGYPVIATVISADLGLVAQRLPGEGLRFTRVDRDLAVAALRDARAALEAIA
jgi:allophanate hydrolase subunit 2